jgi:hypothetical protein
MLPDTAAHYFREAARFLGTEGVVCLVSFCSTIIEKVRNGRSAFNSVTSIWITHFKTTATTLPWRRPQNPEDMTTYRLALSNASQSMQD